MINLQPLIASANQLKPLPETITRLVELLANEDVHIDDIEDVFSYDAALSARLLRQANSVAAGGNQKVGTISAAVIRLGLGNVLALAIAASTQDDLDGPIPQYGLGEGDLWEHSQGARLAVDGLRKYGKVAVPPEAPTAALLHDVGKIVLARHLDPLILKLLRRASGHADKITMAAESEILQVHHGELGGLIAQHWQLPDVIVRGIIYHHDPERCTETNNHICHIVGLANWLSKVASAKLRGQTCAVGAPSSFAHLKLDQARVDKVVDYIVEGLQGLGYSGNKTD